MERYEIGRLAWMSCTFLPLATIGKRGFQDVSKLESISHIVGEVNRDGG